MLRIQNIDVSGLFDRFDYRLPTDGELKDIVIFYGDNGSGKTTLLQLLFHLLSASNTAGHRSALVSIPFREITVGLSDGTKLTAERLDLAEGWPLLLTIQAPGEDKVSWRYIPREVRESDGGRRLSKGDHDQNEIEAINRFLVSEEVHSSSRKSMLRGLLLQSKGQATYLSRLRELAVNVYYISSDRQIRNDALRPSDFKVLAAEGAQLSKRHEGDEIAKVRTALAVRALNDVGRRIANQAVKASNAGSDSANSIYGAVVRKLSGFNFRPTETTVIDELIRQLQVLKQRNNEYAEYEFTTHISFDEIIQDLYQSRVEQLQLVEDILKPYLDGIEARLDALKPIFDTVATFVGCVNQFFTNKKLHYTLTKGFFILDHKERPLSVGDLSSGELQLMLLFSYTLSMRDERAIIIIDEPEISLNVKWQRQLIAALKQVAFGGERPVYIRFAFDRDAR